MLRKEIENCDCLQGIQERFQFMVMLLPKPLYIGIDFSCCSRGFLVISISKPAFDTERSQFGSCEISPIQSLIGLTGRRWVMGVVCQSEDGHFYLEDPSLEQLKSICLMQYFLHVYIFPFRETYCLF
ncbi:uncharacterized protein LOC114291245 [Camellia sinensis]|uniref:uncharacterized protein LOC114291245 n=1 Tax=Camellia sinensis TaxID=4442 RepID=UPI00103650D5|nr:uncharacterized protein LOC114291245 [Camellia sinensis]